MKTFKKWKGGAKKHGGILKAVEKQVSDWVDGTDKEISNSPDVISDIFEQKEDSIRIETSKIKVQEEHVINPNAENLRMEILNYLESSAVDAQIAEDISILIINKLLSNAEVASKVLAYGNKDINTQVKAWVLNHIDKDVAVKTLKLPASLYFVEHPDETDVAQAIRNASDNVKEFAEALFATDHPELTIDIASCLLGDNTNHVTTDDI